MNLAEFRAAAAIDVSRETFEVLSAYAAVLHEEAHTQNLIARSTLDQLWSRHMVDSAQLVRCASTPSKSWIDVGSGAGLPGMVIAILTRAPVTLVEPRRLRAEFLGRCVARLGLSNVTVMQSTAQKVRGSFRNITARAVASLTELVAMTRHLGENGTEWIFPKGERAREELEAAGQSWHYRVRMIESLTNPDSRIVVLSDIRSGVGS